jgi:branched-chain amino acid transport system substrate-binding protein
VVGSAKHAIGASDYSSQLLEAQASGAQVVAFASVGGDLVNLIKQAREFGLGGRGRQTIGGFLIYINDIHALGLASAQGFSLSSSFYWDQSDEARGFGQRFMAATGAMPSKNQAAVYAAVRHYLQAVAATGTVDAVTVNQAMRAAPIDYFGHKAALREDGRLMDDVTLYRVKTPGESHGPWDLYVPVQTIPAAEAYLPANPDCKG